MELCVTDDGADYCPIDVVPVPLPQKKATDISQQLLTACLDLNGEQVKVGLFDKVDIDGDDVLEDVGYFWNLDNKGVRNAELRFYSIETLKESCGEDEDCLACYNNLGVTRNGAVCSS